MSESVISQSHSKQSCSSIGNRNLSNAEGNSMPEVPKNKRRTKKKAGDSSSSRKSSTHIVHDSNEERTTLPCPVPPVGHKQERVSKPATRNSQFPRFEESQDNDSWKTISSKRPAPKKKVLFGGNLRTDVTEDFLQTFVAQRLSAASPSVTVAIHQCSLFKKEKTTSARIVVSARDAPILLDKRFWPRPVYTCSWDFERYRSKDKADSDKDDLNKADSDKAVSDNADSVKADSDTEIAESQARSP